MAGVGGFFGKFFGKTIGDAASFAIGGAVERTIEPELQEVTNESWRGAVALGVNRPLDEGDAAEIVAEDVQLQSWGADQAAQSGIGSDQFAALVQAVLNAPGTGELFRMLRRGKISPSDFLHGLRKTRLETRWDKAMQDLQNEYLDPAVIALGIVRDTVPDPGLQVGAHDTSGSDIQQGDQYPRDVMAEFAASGIDEPRAKVMVQNIGLPMPPVRAANAYFRGLINKASYYLSVAQSDSRPAWADAILEEARQISTAHDAVENHLRGYSQAVDMYNRAARHGMSQADVDILFENAGRPLTVHQITTGLARGGQFNPETNELPDPYEASVHESNIKPSYYDLAIANRYSYPSLFQLNALVKANAITADVAADWATKDGLAPEVVTALHAFWQGEQTSTSGGTTTKPKQFTYSQIHAAWSHGLFSDAEALTELEAIGYPAARAQTLLDTWKRQSTASSA